NRFGIEEKLRLRRGRAQASGQHGKGGSQCHSIEHSFVPPARATDRLAHGIPCSGAPVWAVASLSSSAGGSGDMACNGWPLLGILRHVPVAESGESGKRVQRRT